MIVVDTSIWADHFRKRNDLLSNLIQTDELLQHPYVTGELALGNAKDPRGFIAELELLQNLHVLSHARTMAFALEHDLSGTGIGYVDAHILAAAAERNAQLWTRDKRLAAQAERLGLAFRAD